MVRKIARAIIELIARLLPIIFINQIAWDGLKGLVGAPTFILEFAQRVSLFLCVSGYLMSHKLLGSVERRHASTIVTACLRTIFPFLAIVVGVALWMGWIEIWRVWIGGAFLILLLVYAAVGIWYWSETLAESLRNPLRCASCHKGVSRFFPTVAWLCPNCKRIFCEDCCPKEDVVDFQTIVKGRLVMSPTGHVMEKPNAQLEARGIRTLRKCSHCGTELEEHETMTSHVSEAIS